MTLKPELIWQDTDNQIVIRDRMAALNIDFSNWYSRPGKWLTIYLLFTVIAFLLSPFKTHDIERFWPAIYACAAWLCYYFGQRAGTRLETRQAYIPEPSRRVMNVISLALAVYVIVILGGVLTSFGRELSIDSVRNSLLDPGEAYFDKFRVADEWTNRTSTVMQIYTLTNSLALLLIPVTFIYWRNLNILVRVTCVAAVLMRIAPGLLTGTMVDVGLVVTEIVVTVTVLYASGQAFQDKRPFFWVITIALALLFLTYGVNSLLSRGEATSWRPWEGGMLSYYDPDNPLTYLLGDRVAFGVHLMISYVTNGYEGLGQMLPLGFSWTFGVGHSRALMEYAEQYLGWTWIWDNHYVWRAYASTGRHPLINWHTALPWIASDVSFWGVMPVMLCIGWVFGRLWRQVLDAADPVTLALFGRMVVLVLFLPANFQVFQGRVMWWGTVGLIIIWLMFRTIQRVRDPHADDPISDSGAFNDSPSSLFKTNF